MSELAERKFDNATNGQQQESTDRGFSTAEKILAGVAGVAGIAGAAYLGKEAYEHFTEDDKENAHKPEVASKLEQGAHKVEQVVQGDEHGLKHEKKAHHDQKEGKKEKKEKKKNKKEKHDKHGHHDSDSSSSGSDSDSD